MSSNFEPNKVIDLQSRQAQQIGAPNERFNEIIKNLRTSALKRFGSMVSGMFDGVDDALFDMAEKAENNSIQTRFFDGMREVRKKRPAMERAAQDGLGKAFAEFLQPNRRAIDAQKQQEAGLSLIDEAELEESLAGSSMAGKAENKSSRVLFSMNQRLSVLINGTKVSDDDNPVGPKNVIKAFQNTLKELEGEMATIKLIILKLFDKHVIFNLDSMYEELNQQLVEGGVLPQLKHQTLQRRPGSSGAIAAGAAPNGSENFSPDQAVAGGNFAAHPGPGPMMNQGMPPGMTGMGGGEYAGQSAESALQAEVFNSLRSLLAARHSGYGGQNFAPQSNAQGNYNAFAPMAPMQPQGPTLSAADLINALSILQNQAGSASIGQGMQQGFGFGQPNIQAVAQMKDELIHQAEKLGGADHKVTAADEDTIDLVGMLFEFILQDKNLPAEIQAQLARLQIPYLKVAILDKHLFAKKEHPARRLLDELAQAGVGWSEESDKDHRLFQRIRQIVESLLKDFDEDTGIFEREYLAFVEFFAGLKKRADVAEQRTTETARGREKLHTARKLAAKEILLRMDGKPVPEVIRHVLTRPWANVLVLTSLRQGEDSHQWQASLRVADELIWSAQRKDNDEDRQRLRALAPELEKALRQGLSLVAYQEADVNHLIAELDKLYAVLLEVPVPRTDVRGAGEMFDTIENFEDSGDMPNFDDDESTMLVVEEKAKFTPPPASANDDTNFVDEIVLGEKGEEDEDEGDMLDDSYVETARAIKVGTWVEFRDKVGHIERAKLSWISPISAKYLFVNRKGLKVGDKTVWGLAAELRAGTAEILEDVPLFDRALDAIVERLKNSAAAPMDDAPRAGEPTDMSRQPIQYNDALAEVADDVSVPEGSIGDHL
jgi:hypothetical protein